MSSQTKRWAVFLGSFLCLYTAGAQPYRLDTVAAAPNTSQPLAIAFVPGGSGKFFFTEKATGNIRVFDGSQLLQNPFATVAITSDGEQGLLGIAVHPQYPDTPYVYVYYTSTRADRANFVVRYRDASGVGTPRDTLLVVPRVGIDLNVTNHNGGNIHFGPDGKLYVTIGEYGNNPDHAQDTSGTNYKGKIHRLNYDGTTPVDNPFPGKTFWSYGHRNSFDFTFDSQTGKLYCSENGPSCNDEINLVPRHGNMGWPVDGNCTYSGSPLYVRPLYFFPGPLPALTGITVYRNSAFPRLRGKILFTGNSDATLWTLTLSSSGDTIVPNSFATLFTYSTGFADVEIGPDGNIYLTNGPYSSNRILRLRPVPPTFSSSPPTGATSGVEYTYTPTFNGTPPGLSLISAPAGMTIDSATWTIRWVPTAGQAQTPQPVMVRATNGAGFVDQSWTIGVALPIQLASFSATIATAHTIILEWTTLTEINNYGFVVQRRPEGQTDFEIRAFVQGHGTTNVPVRYRVADSTAGTTRWWYRLKQIDLDGTQHLTTVIEVAPFGGADNSPEKFTLQQNFPNPFNPSTTIHYEIAQTGRVRLRVFNILGQELAVLQDGSQNEGAYSIEFPAQNLPSGVYFYRIEAAGFIRTRKMIIAK